MLKIISRSENEGLVIDDKIRVTVLEVGERFVRLKIEDPKHDPVIREEMLTIEDGGSSPLMEDETNVPPAERIDPVAAL